MHSVKMRRVATHVAWSVCLFVTSVSLQKQMSGSRCRWNALIGGEGTMYGGFTLAPLGEYQCFSLF